VSCATHRLDGDGMFSIIVTDSEGNVVAQKGGAE